MISFYFLILGILFIIIGYSFQVRSEYKDEEKIYYITNEEYEKLKS